MKTINSLNLPVITKLEHIDESYLEVNRSLLESMNLMSSMMRFLGRYVMYIIPRKGSSESTVNLIGQILNNKFERLGISEKSKALLTDSQDNYIVNTSDYDKLVLSTWFIRSKDLSFYLVFTRDEESMKLIFGDELYESPKDIKEQFKDLIKYALFRTKIIQ